MAWKLKVTCRHMAPLLTALLSGCASPYFSQMDGTFVFPESGARAATVTPNGIVLRDRADMPSPIRQHDPFEPWTNPVGFIMPESQRFTQASAPTVMATTGLVVVLRPSDTRVPSWGGEILVRVDVIAPVEGGVARKGEDLAIILDGNGNDTLSLAAAAIGQLGGNDRISVVDTKGVHLVVPKMPAGNRSLALAAIAKRLSHDRRRDTQKASLPGAFRFVRDGASSSRTTRVVLLSDGASTCEACDVPETVLLPDSIPRETVATGELNKPAEQARYAERIKAGWSGGVSTEARKEAIRGFVPVSGPTVFRNMQLSFEGCPAPGRLLETSGGEILWNLEADKLDLGDLRGADARTEVVRVTVPAWTATIPFKLTVTANFDDPSYGSRQMQAPLYFVYDEDVVQIAESRAGDVLAYASALATLKRLDAAFVGPGINQAGGLYAVAQLHLKSMQALAQDTGDRAFREQASFLEALLSAGEK